MTDAKKNNLNRTAYWPSEPGSGPAPVSSKVDFPGMDHAVADLWEARRVFARTISEREGRPNYVVYDGPPGTNGAPHIGHMMQSALKDLWPRYFTMKGYRVLRKAGWDTHGLPVELTAEKELGFKSKRDIENYGVERYIEYCRSAVYRYKDAWTQAIKRIGRFLDTDDYYATLTTDYIQTDWWALKQAWDKGLLYQDRRIMPYCARCGTSLSQHETAQGYRDIQDVSLYVKFPVVGQEKTFFVAWTTTPWTLLSNVALAINPSLIYATIETRDGESLIVAKDRVEAMKGVLGDGCKYHGDRDRLGSSLADLHYRPLWEFQTGAQAGGHSVVADDYVTAADGSGIVHLALYGEDDFRLIKKNGLPFVQNVDADGKCTPNTGQFAGRWFRDEGLDVDILKDLASRGLLLGKEKITHSYPHCYRCDTPLMFFAKSGWFLKTTAIKDQMLAANSKINWYPEHIRDGRFGNWLENNVDWNISRERYWGSPLPIWTCGGCGDRVCVKSLADLEEHIGKPLPKGFDPHKPHIDKVELKCSKCGGIMKREPEVLDSWFNAGIMPWGQWGYPATNGSMALFSSQFPADFICEAIDQTRGWFYTLLATSVFLDPDAQSSFKNVICTELINDPEGRKMSKSRGNVVDPVELCDKFGADAVRWNFYCINPWTARRFDEAALGEALKQVLIPYWNAYSFFVTYARVDKWQPSGAEEWSDHLLDRWILSRLESLQVDVCGALERYDVTVAATAISQFIDELTNWYIRRSRRRFWKSVDDADKRAAYATLYEVLRRLNTILAPFIPFTSEAIYQNLERGYNANAPESVHLSLLPDKHPEWRDEALEEAMKRAQNLVSLARSLRNEGGARVRQPLSKLVFSAPWKLDNRLQETVLSELNVKELEQIDDATALVKLRAKPNLKSLGPILGGRLKEATTWIAARSDDELRRFRSGAVLEFNDYRFQGEDLLIEETAPEGWWVRSDSGVAVALDYRLNDELVSEGLARELVHIVQNLRKEADLDVAQRIKLQLGCDGKVGEAVDRHRDYISNETLAVGITTPNDTDSLRDFRIGEYSARIGISVA